MMAILSWSVYEDFPKTAGPTLFTDVQSISIRMGRTQIQDPYKAGTATITGRNPDNLPVLGIGYPIRITETDGVEGGPVFHGFVTDLRIDYGTVSEEDTWTLEIEDVLARAGRAVTSSSFSWSAGIRTNTAAFQAANDCGIDLYDVWTTLSYVSQGQSFVSAQSLPNTNLLNILNLLAATEQGRICQESYDLGWVNRSDLGQNPFAASFTDGTLTANYGAVPYTNVAFSSLADSSYEAVIVEPDGLAAQFAGVSDSRTFTMQSYDQTTTQAGNLAAYVLATLGIVDPVPLTVSAVDYNQPGSTFAELLQQVNRGCYAELILRGDRYNLYLEGMTVTAVPGSTRATFNVVSTDAQSFFILDNTTFGVLDTSRLGF